MGPHIVAKAELVGQVKNNFFVGNAGPEAEAVIVVRAALGRGCVVKDTAPYGYHEIVGDD